MISTEQRRALEMLADAESRSNTIEMLIEDGVPAEMVADLVRNGLASMQGDTVKVADARSRSSGCRSRTLAGAPLKSRNMQRRLGGPDPVPSWASGRPPP